MSVGTGVAINDAESGVASALIVHAASLENQFVAQGFSKEPVRPRDLLRRLRPVGPGERPGRGPDAARRTTSPRRSQEIAAAGAAGKADFVSRGGTPGTTVQEHAIWALDAGLPG